MRSSHLCVEGFLLFSSKRIDPFSFVLWPFFVVDFESSLIDSTQDCSAEPYQDLEVKNVLKLMEAFYLNHKKPVAQASYR